MDINLFIPSCIYNYNRASTISTAGETTGITREIGYNYYVMSVLIFFLFQSQAALMYDAVQVLVDAIIRLMRKKPDILRSTLRRNANLNSSKILDCNPKGKVVSPYEHGDKISRMIKKV